MVPDSIPKDNTALLRQYRSLLEINNAVVSQLDLRELLRTTSAILRQHIHHDTAGISLYEKASGMLRAFALDNPPEHWEEGLLLPLEGTPHGLAFQTRQAVWRERIDLTEFPATAVQAAYQVSIRSGCAVPLIARDRVIGVLAIGSQREGSITSADAEMLQLIANQIASAVANALNFERARKAEQEVQRKLERERLMLEINNAVVTQLDLRELARVTAARLREVLQHDITGISLYDPAINQFRAYMFDLPDTLPAIPEGTPMPLEGTVGGMAFLSGQPVFMNRPDPGVQASEFDRRLMEAGIQSGGVIPLIAHDRKLGFLGVGSFQEDAFSEADQELLCHIANQIAIAVENALNFERAQVAEQQAKRQAERVQLLLQVNNAIASALDLPSLFRAVSACLRQVFRLDYAVMGLYNEQEDILRVHVLDRGEGIELLQEGQIATLDDTPVGLAIRTKQVVVTGVDYLAQFPSEVVRRAVSQGIRANCSAPLLRQNRVIGAMSMASKTEAAFTQDDGELFMKIADQVAIAVENALNFERTRKAEQEVTRQLARERLMLEINNAVVSHLDLRELMHATSASLRAVIPHDFVGITLYDAEQNVLRPYVYMGEQPEGMRVIEEGMAIPLASTPLGEVFTSERPLLLTKPDPERFTSDLARRILGMGVKSGCGIPLLAHNRKLGVLGIGSYREEAFTAADLDLLTHIASQLAIAVENALAFREIETLKNKLASEKLYLEDEIRTEHNFEELIGASRSFKRILKQIETVAPTDSAVLIRGETGTGKELIARAIHNLSTRRERTLVKLNCAAIPTGLLESELFGHEKGAFTGAITQRIGRFELAHHGTLLLDEIGDIPVELQPKLLRVLQEQEFERLGSTRTQKVNVRMIAATNADLEQLVAEKKYRSDLYYRLNVFPITIPPLRERAEDIPLLARFFTRKYARRMKKPIEAIPAEAMEALTAYHWPGNVRELEHFIERAVVLTQGTALEISQSELKPMRKPAAVSIPTDSPSNSSSLATLEAAEREHILRALAETNWVIGGPQGAAARLGMKRTTLQSRMQKLGITR
ncbi:MAG: sigma 54-interacting transcriptional regulator [Acidobacteria bacterium]|nr:sigma 54-interacting transcriptional regulator [Acidobacteriota bacterium]